MESKILLIDDDPELVFMTRIRLQAAGYRVSTACDGEQGLAAARQEEPDLILLDVMMPGMDGFSVLERLKADDSTRCIPVIMLTASGETKFIFKAEQMGADDYVVKPFEAPALLRLIAGHITRSRTA